MATLARTKPDTGVLQAKVVCKDGLLKVMGNLQRADYSVFQDLCRQLCSAPIEHITIDFSLCTYVSSLVIGTLVDTVTRLKTDGKHVTVRVSPEVGRFLHLAHLYHLFAYEIVEAHGPK